MGKFASYPRQIKYIIGNEAAERFSYYGMRSILVVFMVQQLQMAEHNAKAAFHLFASASYFFPFLGGYLSDRYLGKYKTIIYLSIVYCLGHGVLALWESETGVMLGLGLIAIGAGGIKPCVSAHVGDQFTESNKHLVKGVFDIFYWAINFGSFFSTMLIPWTYKHYGSQVAFGLPGILMALATWIFWLGRNQYVHVKPTKQTGEKGFLSIFWEAVRRSRSVRATNGFLSKARNRFSEREIEGAQAAGRIFKLFTAVSLFWALFEQHNSSWVLQARQMNLHFLGMDFEASQIAALNPLMVMLLIPFASYVLYPLCQKLGFKMTPLRRMSTGMIIAAFSFVFVGIYQTWIDQGETVSIAWHLIPYLIITLAEVMLSITGLEFAYSQAPRSMKSTLMSFWILTFFAGNFIAAIISKINVFKGADFFYFFAALMGVFAVGFVWMASRFKVKDYFEP